MPQRMQAASKLKVVQQNICVWSFFFFLVVAFFGQAVYNSYWLIWSVFIFNFMCSSILFLSCKTCNLCGEPAQFCKSENPWQRGSFYKVHFIHFMRFFFINLFKIRMFDLFVFFFFVVPLLKTTVFPLLH